MRRLKVHIFGAGAVGLSYGYLLTASGHEVVHTSLRGAFTVEIPVVARIDGRRVRALYAPRFHQADGFAADVNLFAVRPEACPRYLGAPEVAAAGASGSINLILACEFDVEWRRRFAQWPAFDPQLAFPLISCEHRPGDGLSLVTDGEMEILSPARSDLRPVLEAMGWRVSGSVGIERFRARYVQTAAVYAVLSGLNLKVMTIKEANEALLLDVFTDLRDAAEAASSKLDFPAPPETLLALLPLLIAASADGRADDILLRNLRSLMADGRKLASHLRPLKPLWSAYMASSPGRSAPARALMASVMAAA